MKMKRFIAGLLSLIMMISMVGTVDVNAAESTYGEEIASNLTSGTYTDDSADVNEDYVYTIVGSDGSVAEVSTDTYDGIAEGYWRVQWENGSFDSATIQDGVYLIVNKNLQKAIKKADGCSYGGDITVTGEFLAYAETWSDWEWSITKVEDKYTISTGTDTPKYMKINYDTYQTTADTLANGNSAVSLSDDEVELTITTVTANNKKSEAYERNTVFIGDTTVGTNGGGWLNARGSDYAGTWYDPDAGSCIRLYKKGYRVSDERLAEITDQVGTALDYTTSSWNEYVKALENVYSICDTKDKAAQERDALITAVEALKSAEVEVVGYEKLEATSLPETGDYMIVSGRMYDSTDPGEIWALSSERIGGTQGKPDNLQLVKIEGTENVVGNVVWYLDKQAEGTYYIKSMGNGKYLNIDNYQADAGLQFGFTGIELTIASHDNNMFSIAGTDRTGNIGYMNSYKQPGDGWTYQGMATWNTAPSSDIGARQYLYQVKYCVGAAVIEEIEAGVGTEGSYTTESWAEYQAALEAAKVQFATKVAAEEALDTLREAVNGLVKVDTSVLVGTSQYVKLTGLVAPEDGIYLIVGANSGSSLNKAIKHDIESNGGLTYNDISSYIADSTIEFTDSYENYEWEIVSTGTEGKYTILAVDDKKYMNIEAEDDDTGAVALKDNPQELMLKTWADDDWVPPYGSQEPIADSYHVGGINTDDNTDTLGYINYRAGSVGTFNGDGWVIPDRGSAHYLYKKLYKVDTDKFEAMVGSAADYDEEAYSAYSEALEAAKAVTAGPANEVYDLHVALREATKALVENESVISTKDTDGWTNSGASMDVELVLSADASLVKTEAPLVFDLLDATGFELLATCGKDTGIVMAVVKAADGTTLRAYLVDTYYGVDTSETNIPIVRDLNLAGGETVDVYGCVVQSIIDKRVSTMSVGGRAIEVTTDDIVMAVLQELGLENELDVADVAVSCMDEESVLKGGTISGVNTYSVSAVADEATTESTTYSVSVQGCRIYKPADGVTYVALSDLVKNGNTAFITEVKETENVTVGLADYQKTGPQNEIYLDNGESIAIGLASEPSATYEIGVRGADGAIEYQDLTFAQVDGVEGYQATISNEGTSTVALGIIKVTGVTQTTFMMNSAMAEAIVAAMNAVPSEPVEEPKDQWIRDGKGWWYSYGEGGWPANRWENIDGKWYWFGADGYMKTGWLYNKGTWYYLSESGAMATGWLKLGSTWYYLNESGAMATGWLKLGSTWYYLDASGAMATGWLKLGSTWYYLDASGAMATGWLKLGSTWYYLDASGAMATGWKQIGGTRYYFKADGAWSE